MSAVAKLSVVLSANASGLVAGFKEGEQAANRFRRNMQGGIGGGGRGFLFELRAMTGARSAFGMLTKTLAGGGAIAALGYWINRLESGAKKFADAMGDAKKSGGDLVAEFISGIPIIGSAAGIIENLGTAVGNAIVRWRGGLVEFNAEAAKAVAALEDIRDKAQGRIDLLGARSPLDRDMIEAQQRYDSAVAEAMKTASVKGVGFGSPEYQKTIDKLNEQYWAEVAAAEKQDAERRRTEAEGFAKEEREYAKGGEEYQARLAKKEADAEKARRREIAELAKEYRRKWDAEDEAAKRKAESIAEANLRRTREVAELELQYRYEGYELQRKLLDLKEREAIEDAKKSGESVANIKREFDLRRKILGAGQGEREVETARGPSLWPAIPLHTPGYYKWMTGQQPDSPTTMAVKEGNLILADIRTAVRGREPADWQGGSKF